jgi:uncharacterized membrane protein YhiD involved in acid resistance
MDKINLDFLANQTIQIDLTNFIINLITAVILSFLVRETYNKTARTLSNVKNFSKNFVILCLTTAIIITIVKSSLALSLGLVGALSIVRFRAAIKEPEELVFLFLIISIGLGCGAGQLSITIIGTIISIIIIWIFYRFESVEKKIEIENFNISIISKKKLEFSKIKNIIDIVTKDSDSCELISVSQHTDGTTVNLLSRFTKLNDIEKVDNNLKKKFPSLDFVLVRESINNV